MKTTIALKTLLGAASLTLPLMAHAESNVQTGAAGLTATAHVDFQITIPKILYLRVGTGSAYNTGTLATDPTVNLITWAPTAAQVGTGALAGVGGDVGGGVVTAALVSNSGGVITFSSTAAAAGLSNGAGDFIPFSQITTTATAGIQYPTLLGALALTGGGTSTTITPATHVYLADAKWTYSFVNNAFPAVGTYGGINTNNSRVTYTAAVP